MNHHENDSSPHRRYNPLTGEWVLVSPHRTRRPWTGQQEKSAPDLIPQYDSSCYLCPGNIRANGTRNPSYTDTFIFDNDYGALLSSHAVTQKLSNTNDLLRTEPEAGICRVICYSPRHDLTMARMSVSAIEGVISTWQKEFCNIGSREAIRYVQIFENKGLMMGCSNPHPHGQIWATSSIPTIPASESRNQQEYLRRNRSCLLCDYVEREINENSRIIFSNTSFIALVPFWALWPFETMILPRRHVSSILNISTKEKSDLAAILQSVTTCYDNLFQTSFPYSMGIHQQPSDNADYDFWHYHIHFLPPLLRSHSVKKHMVGFELLAMPQRDLTPEMAADSLRAQSTIHYQGAESK